MTTSAADKDRVELVAPDPSWAARFEAEAAEQLALRFPQDREAYTEGKAAFVAKVLTGAALP